MCDMNGPRFQVGDRVRYRGFEYEVVTAPEIGGAAVNYVLRRVADGTVLRTYECVLERIAPASEFTGHAADVAALFLT